MTYHDTTTMTFAELRAKATLTTPAHAFLRPRVPLATHVALRFTLQVKRVPAALGYREVWTLDGDRLSNVAAELIANAYVLTAE